MYYAQITTIKICHGSGLLLDAFLVYKETIYMKQTIKSTVKTPLMLYANYVFVFGLNKATTI